MTYRLRRLAEMFGVSLKRVRRWSQAALPADPRARKQAGLAREYTKEEVFRLLLIGFLVSNLPLTFGEANRILAELENFFQEQGLMVDRKGYPGTISIRIHRSASGFSYEWKKIISRIPNQDGTITEIFQEGMILIGNSNSLPYLTMSPYLFPIQSLLETFQIVIFLEENPGAAGAEAKESMKISMGKFIFGSRDDDEKK